MKLISAVSLAIAVASGTALVGTRLTSPGHEPVALRADAGTGLHATLQRDADGLLTFGAPGVLADLQTPTGRVRVRSGYGNVTAKTPVPWQARFRIGSSTKTFVAATLLQLVGEGKLNLDDPVERWLPGVVAGNGNDGNAITVRQLLQHTSGLHDYLQDMTNLFTDQEAFERDRFTTRTPSELVAQAMKSPPNFAPGTNWSYSNTNYILVGMIIERVTGHTWQQEVRTRIIEPLHLRDTSIPVTSPQVPEPHAIGYNWFTADGPATDVTAVNPSLYGAAGSIISTTADTDRFLRALIGGKVLHPAQLAEMQHTVRASEFDSRWPGVRYGLGLMWIPNSCGGFWSHGGNIHGYTTQNGISADGSRAITVSINGLPKPGTPPPDHDPTIDLIDHALCGTE